MMLLSNAVPTAVTESSAALRMVLCCLLVALTMVPAHGQVSNSGLTGQVADPTGAIVPNATVTVTNQNTGLKITATTNDDGIYRVVQLQPGTYSIEATQPGFKRAFRSAI